MRWLNGMSRVKGSPLMMCSHQCPCSNTSCDREEDSDEECKERPTSPFELYFAHLRDDLLSFTFCLFWHPCWYRIRRNRWLAQGWEEDERSKYPKWREHYETEQTNQYHGDVYKRKKKNLQNPNLKRYIASVTGSAYGVYSGRLDSST